MKRILLLTIGCALVLGGCRGGRRDPALSVRQQNGAAAHPSWADELSDRRLELVLGNYGKRLIRMQDRNWKDMILYPQGVVPEIEWFSRFGSFLELDAEEGSGAEVAQMDSRQARSAMISYITEKMYPVKMGLNIVRGGRRFLLGDYIDSYIQELKLRRSGGDFELIYKKDF